MHIAYTISVYNWSLPDAVIEQSALYHAIGYCLAMSSTVALKLAIMQQTYRRGTLGYTLLLVRICVQPFVVFFQASPSQSL